ncbi:copper resistance CopC family protein [Auraticoccus monumenti]|uniref:CopC domain-containing protein n=1 Tax=Auraticoccus monumenti TaxID=675864 RepID=A0A1G7A2A5_9ACTN|nr:copper resistance CopC family protein [Auraticoccus monumenti]SDE08871.1 CopC domain-containing protein [Auraticoccus monumenti]
MHPTERPSEHPRPRLLVALLLSLGLALTPSAPVARAHSALESSTPGAGSTIEAMPAQLELVFSEEVQEVGADVVLVDEQGDSWTAGPAEVDAVVVTSPVEPDVPDGRYEIRWTIISVDGAPMAGDVRFVLGDEVDDVHPLDVVLTAQDATRVLVGALAVLVAVLAHLVHGLLTVYGSHPTTAGTGQKENHHE